MLALIAGSGRLPAAVMAGLEQPPLVCALEGFVPDGVPVDNSFRIETLGSLLKMLREKGVTAVCFAGAIERPEFDPSKIDTATMPLVPVMMQALADGDDGALRAVILIFEQAGFTVQAAHDIAPNLLPGTGCITQVQPDDPAKRDAERAQQIVDGMAAVDVGQSCAVGNGQALGIEGVFGTDWMLHSLSNRPDGTGGVFFKAPKSGQDRRADLPTIGPDTVQKVADAHLGGLVIEAGGVMVLDLAGVIAECDRLNLFLWVRERIA
ncbi:MAG: UDP-2,3-diacylglucosamine diphosphatase LpxI [Rhodobacteraceae bacterium]|nr:UDP-2,3-diacylglucosamine diphosphatase LpxI [Paracoccaceae bacterium]